VSVAPQTPVADLLGTIVAATRRIVEVRQARESASDLARRAAATMPRPGAFTDALARTDRLHVIAECKRRSPSRGVLRNEYDPVAIARAYTAAGAAAISVLTEPTFFDGAPDHLRAVRSAVAAPLLRKDFIVSEYQVAEAAALGADAVLLIVAALDQPALRRMMASAEAFGLACLVEAHESDEVKRAVDAGARIIGVNSRNLRTLAVDHAVLDRAASMLPAGVTAVAESGIKSSDDIRRLSDAGYHAFLVGERLISQPDPGAALQALRGVPA
jgi:indole-3-glycerol phosphate synthase